MKIELSQEQTFTARAGDQLVHGLRITSEWEGLRKLVDGTGRHMIVDADGIVLKGTPALLHDLHLTVLDDDGFVQFPQTTLPSGRVVPAFQVAIYESTHENERRWHQLSTGARIWDFSGNVWSWMHDDLHGDDDGLVKGSIPVDSPLLTSAPAKSCQKGVGYIPDGPLNWSGNALIRGGYWCSDDYASVFDLRYVWPGSDGSYVGVRCTK